MEYKHKIAGIPLETCSAEQKIAYNILSKYRDLGVMRAAYNNAIETAYTPAGLSEEFKQITADALFEIEKACTVEVMGANIAAKYNRCAIRDALVHGFMRYMREPFIADNYEKIGEVFWII